METLKQLDRELHRDLLKLQMQNRMDLHQIRVKLVAERGEDYVSQLELQFHVEYMNGIRPYLEKYGVDPLEYEKEILNA